MAPRSSEADINRENDELMGNQTADWHRLFVLGRNNFFSTVLKLVLRFSMNVINIFLTIFDSTKVFAIKISYDAFICDLPKIVKSNTVQISASLAELSSLILIFSGDS